jgi:hypothetical protein
MPGAEQIMDLLEAEPDALGRVDDREPAEHSRRVSPLA